MRDTDARSFSPSAGWVGTNRDSMGVIGAGYPVSMEMNIDMTGQNLGGGFVFIPLNIGLWNLICGEGFRT